MDLLSVKEAAQMFNVCDDTIRRLIRKDGRIKTYKVKGQWRIDKKSLLSIVETFIETTAKNGDSKIENKLEQIIALLHVIFISINPDMASSQKWKDHFVKIIKGA